MGVAFCQVKASNLSTGSDYGETLGQDRKMILDVGCGDHPAGDVNLDVERHLKPNDFILGDACFLPFRDESFDVVYASHVLEHAGKPLEVLREFHRVTKKCVYLHIPYGDKTPDNDPQHLYTWTMKSLQHLLLKIFPKVEVYTTERAAHRIVRKEPTSMVGGILLWIIRKLRHTIFWRTQITALCYKLGD